jgi:hypothetical protein
MMACRLEPHEVLGLPRGASREDVSKKYRKLASVLHPDKNGSSALFNLISDAHTRLTEPPSASAQATRRPATTRSKKQRSRPAPNHSWKPFAPKVRAPPAEPPKIIPVGQNTTTIRDVNHQWPEVKLATCTESRASRNAGGASSAISRREATTAVLAAVLNAVTHSSSALASE